MTFQSWVQVPGRATTEPGVRALGLLWDSSCGLTHFPQVQGDTRTPPLPPCSTQACAQQSSEQTTLSTIFSSSALLKLFWFHAICHFFFGSKIGYLIVLKPTLNSASVWTPQFFNTCYKCLWMSNFSEQSFSGQFSFLNYMKLDWLCCMCSLGQAASSLTWQIVCGKKSLSTACCSTELRKPQHKTAS